MTIADEIAAIREAIASGARKIRTKTNGVEREVEYPSFDDLKKRLDYLQSLNVGAGRSRVSLASFSKGR